MKITKKHWNLLKNLKYQLKIQYLENWVKMLSLDEIVISLLPISAVQFAKTLVLA